MKQQEQTKENKDKLYRKELINELRYIENLIREEKSVDKKTYYFSAANGITSRTLRYSFTGELLLADFVLNSVYKLLLDRINRIKNGDPTVQLEIIHFEKICDGLKLLADNLEKGNNIQKPLEVLMTTAFSTTGPGNYLREKELLKI